MTLRNGATSTMRRTRLTSEGRGKQRDQRAGRMAEHEVGAAAVGQHDLGEELVEIGDIVVEAPDMAAHRVADQPVGAALAAPVHDGAAEAARRKIADRLEILLDAFVAAGKDDDRALQRARRARRSRP